MQNIIEQLQKEFPDLQKSEIEGLLYIIRLNSDIDSNDLIRKTGVPKETIRKFRSLFKIETLKDPETVPLKPYKWSLLEYSDGELVEKLREIRKKYKLVPKRDFDQFFATEETSISKVKVMVDRGQVEGKHIALIGDDDLISIVLGLSGQAYADVTVFDIDQDILSVIETISKDLGLSNVRTELLDVRTGLRPHFNGKYDVVVTDPPYTRNGIALFLNTAVKLIKKEGYIFLYYGNSFKSPEKTVKIQEVINQYNLVVEDKINKYARYYGAESIGSASSLYILKATPFTSPVKDFLVSGNIYTFEDQREDKFPYVDHFTFKVYNVPLIIVDSKKALLKITSDFCAAHRLKVIDTKVTQFKGKGLTLTYILGASNLLVHTWPELQAVHIDLITCSPIYNKEEMGETLSKLFGTSSLEIRKIE